MLFEFASPSPQVGKKHQRNNTYRKENVRNENEKVNISDQPGAAE
jgi:hypothetical protein